jgi:hypothetical protein
MANDTYTDQIRKWMVPTVKAIHNECIRLCSGPLLKIASGQLVNSFYTYISPDFHNALIWNTSPHMYIWEFIGLGNGVKKAPKGHAFQIIKRGALSQRSQKGIIYRQTIKVSGRYSKPVRPMSIATRNVVLGPDGEQRRQDLGFGIGWVITMRFIRMLEQKGVNVQVRVV